jgi:hypothetical protein
MIETFLLPELQDTSPKRKRGLTSSLACASGWCPAILSSYATVKARKSGRISKTIPILV